MYDQRRQGAEAFVRADVAGGLFAADVLLAGLERQHEARRPCASMVSPGDAAGHLADVLLARGHEAEVRPAERHRHAQALALAGDDVGAHRAGGLEHAQRDRIARDDQQRPLLVRGSRRGR